MYDLEGKFMSEVNFLQSEQNDTRGDVEFKHTLYAFTYAQGRFTQYYLDIPLDEAKERFTNIMNNRNPFEMEDEGWDCQIVTLNFTEVGECWVGNPADQMQALSNMLMGKLGL